MGDDLMLRTVAHTGILENRHLRQQTVEIKRRRVDGQAAHLIRNNKDPHSTCSSSSQPIAGLTWKVWF